MGGCCSDGSSIEKKKKHYFHSLHNASTGFILHQSPGGPVHITINDNGIASVADTIPADIERNEILISLEPLVGCEFQGGWSRVDGDYELTFSNGDRLAFGRLRTAQTEGSKICVRWQPSVAQDSVVVYSKTQLTAFELWKLANPGPWLECNFGITWTAFIDKFMCSDSSLQQKSTIDNVCRCMRLKRLGVKFGVNVVRCSEMHLDCVRVMRAALVGCCADLCEMVLLYV